MTRHSEPPTPSPGQDRRRSLRAPLIVQRVRLTEERSSFFGYAKNISRGGLFIGATSPKEPGSQFQVEIPLPEPLDRTVHCTCEVMWCRQWSKGSTLEPGMGMRFLDLPEEEAEAIDHWIEESRRRQRLGN